jgi:hypothetical protein
MGRPPVDMMIRIAALEAIRQQVETRLVND